MEKEFILRDITMTTSGLYIGGSPIVKIVDIETPELYITISKSYISISDDLLAALIKEYIRMLDYNCHPETAKALQYAWTVIKKYHCFEVILSYAWYDCKSYNITIRGDYLKIKI
jgi:hypothetical protein